MTRKQAHEIVRHRCGWLNRSEDDCITNFDREGGLCVNRVDCTAERCGAVNQLMECDPPPAGELMDAAKGIAEFARNPSGSFLQKRIIAVEDAIAATEKRYAACDHETHDEQGAHDYCPKCGCPMWAKYGGEK